MDELGPPSSSAEPRCSQPAHLEDKMAGRTNRPEPDSGALGVRIIPEELTRVPSRLSSALASRCSSVRVFSPASPSIDSIFSFLSRVSSKVCARHSTIGAAIARLLSYTPLKLSSVCSSLMWNTATFATFSSSNLQSMSAPVIYSWSLQKIQVFLMGQVLQVLGSFDAQSINEILISKLVHFPM